MNTTKTLLLAAVSALSIGVGAAMAQSEMPSSGEGQYYQQKSIHAPVQHEQVQAGDSDVRANNGHAIDFSTLANPG
jgi:hypothetical protein